MKSKLLALLLLLICSHFSYAIETKIIVRAKAKDAKFIGSSLGGAYVKIINKMTGETLAQGKTQGSTGNTGLIMKTPRTRGTTISDDNTSKFMASIDIEEPTFVIIEVFSPINNKQARITASTEIWLIPGKHILGDGVVLEIPGFIIDILNPRTHQFIELSSLENNTLKIQANIVMMCGCTISKNGLWDSEKMEVKAIIKHNGTKLTEITLNNMATNFFEGNLPIKEKGIYEAIVYAYSESTGNTGVDKVSYIIQ